jgi:hypothetical protein
MPNAVGNTETCYRCGVRAFEGRMKLVRWENGGRTPIFECKAKRACEKRQKEEA